MNFRELFDNAQHQIDTYKHPNLGDFKDKMSEILEAADLGGIRNDTIESIWESDDTIYIETSWYVRGCDNSSSYQFPSYIIDAEDPIAAAKAWGIEKKLAEATQQLNAAKRQVEYYKEKIAKLKEQA